MGLDVKLKYKVSSKSFKKVKRNFFRKKFKRGKNSGNIHARVINLFTHDVSDDKKQILEV
jgi:hypothetical protein